MVAGVERSSVGLLVARAAMLPRILAHGKADKLAGAESNNALRRLFRRIMVQIRLHMLSGVRSPQ